MGKDFTNVQLQALQPQVFMVIQLQSISHLGEVPKKVTQFQLLCLFYL